MNSPNFQFSGERDKVVIAGCSGVGKSVLIGRLMKEHESNFAFSVSHTSRQPRGSEIDGVHYHFRTEKAFKDDAEKGTFLEYAQVHGNYYGTSRAAVQEVVESGRVCILDVDVQAVESLHNNEWGGETGSKPLFVFIAPPSMKILEERLRGRGTDSETSIQVRLGNASSELEYSKESGKFDYILINDDLEEAWKELSTLISKECGIAHSRSSGKACCCAIQ